MRSAFVSRTDFLDLDLDLVLFLGRVAGEKKKKNTIKKKSLPRVEDDGDYLEGRLKAELKRVGDDFRPAQAYLEEWGYPVKPGQSLPYTAARGAGFSPHRTSAPAP